MGANTSCMDDPGQSKANAAPNMEVKRKGEADEKAASDADMKQAEEWRAKTHTKNVEEQLLYDELAEQYKFKILLLGAGESGKSTILKQLKNIHDKKGKLSKEETARIIVNLHQNCVDCMKAILSNMEKYALEITDEKLQKVKDMVDDFPDDTRLSPTQAEDLQALWKSDAIQGTYENRADFWILDSCEYYMENITRFAEEDFMPTEEDAVRVRIRTTGIIVSDLKSRYDRKPDEPPHLSVKIVDVGGQRNERKKWMHCFDDVKCILFLASLAGYKQVLFEDSKVNRVREALMLFQEITHKNLFKDTPIFLFLNKKDLFEQMIRKHKLSECDEFADYKGNSSYQSAFGYIKHKFREQLPAGKEVEIFDVTGVSRRDVKEAFQEVKKRLLEIHRPAMEKKKADINKRIKALRRSGPGCSMM